MLCSTSKSPLSSVSTSNRRHPATRALSALAFTALLSTPAFAAINVNKAFAPDAVKAGSPSKVTFYFLNNGIVDATELAFTDELPPGMFVASTPNVINGCVGTLTIAGDAKSVTYSGGTIPKAVDSTPGHCEISFDVVVPNPNVLINTIPVGAVTTSQGSNTQAAEATLNVTGLAPITGTKTFNPQYVHGFPAGTSPIPANGKSTVTITLTNPNDVALTNVTFTDNLPSSASTPPVAGGGIVVSPEPNGFTGCGGTFAPVAGAKTATLSGGTIPAFGSCQVKFDVVAENPAAIADTTLTNTIPAGGVTTYEGPTNAGFSGTIRRQTGVNFTKAFSGTIASGGVATMTITVANYNTGEIPAVVFTDNLPTGMTIADPAQPAFNNTDCQSPTSTYGSGFVVSAPAGGTSVSVTAGKVKGAPTSANPASCTIRVNVTALNDGKTNKSYLNVIPAGTWSSTIPYPEARATLTVQPPNPLPGSKSFDPPTVIQGQTSVATIKLTNSSGVKLTGIAFTDNVQTKMGGAPGPITVAPSPAPATDCGMTPTISPDSKVISFAGGTLEAGAVCTITFTVQTYGNTNTGNHTNTIDANAVSGNPPTGDPIKNYNAFSANLNVVAPASASKAFNPPTVPMGTESLLTITVARASTSPAWSGFTITDTLPAGYVFTATAPPASTCVGTPVVSPDNTSITFTSASTTIPASGASCTIKKFVRTPDTCVSGTNLCTDTNRIPPGGLQVTFSGGGGYSNLGNIDGMITRSSTYVTLTKSFDDPVVDLGGTSMMYLRIVNTAGNAIALTGVNLSDTLPTGLVVATQPTGWPKFTGAGCSLGTLTAVVGSGLVTLTNANVGALRTCTIEVMTQANAAGNLINQVPERALTSTQLVTNLEPVAATITSTGLVNLSVTKTDGVTELKAGGTTTYTVTVSNADGANLAAVAGATFSDTPPAGMTFTSWSCVGTAGTVCAANGTGAIVDFVTIPKGGSVTYTIQALLDSAYATSTVKNCASIMAPASVIDTNLTDNEACDTDNVPRGLILKKVWINALEGDAITATTSGLVNNATVSSTADATGNNTTTGTQVFNLAGGTVTLPTEQFTNGSSSNYTTTLSCTGVQLSGSTAPQSFEMPNADVVCTYTNTRVERKLTLVKKWVNAKEGHAVGATTMGLANNATVSSTADATGNNTTTGTTVSNVAGGTVTLPAESFTSGTQAEYTTTLACEGATASQAVPPATFTMPENDVTCTYTNTRVTYTVKLVKTWIDGKPGDAITVSTQGLASNASVTSTSTGNNTDAGSTASNAPGAAVTLPAETFTTGTVTDYTTTVACTGAELSGNAPGATFTMPAGNVECTYTNQRKRLEVNAVAACINDVPYVNYTVTPFGFTPGTDPVTIQWFDSSNTLRLTLTGLPLTGRLLWPGAAIDIDGFPTDWPGWDFISGVWVEVNDGLRQPMRIVVSVNPSVEVNVTYPAATAACAPPKRAPPPPPLVSAVPVGSPEGLAMMAALLALLGAWSARRRARR